MVTILRVVDDEGVGMYMSNRLSSYLYGHTSLYEECERRPTPDNDVMLAPEWSKLSYGHAEWFFGFRDATQMYRWLYWPAVRNAFMRKAVVEVWECPDGAYLYGTTQAVFKRAACKRVARINFGAYLLVNPEV